MPEEKIKPVLEYRADYFPCGGNLQIKLYADGKVKATTKKYDLQKKQHVEEILKEIEINSQEVDNYAARLFNDGFFSLDNRYREAFILDGIHESLTLNYQKKSKTVKCENSHPSSEEFNKIITELVDLVKVET